MKFSNENSKPLRIGNVFFPITAFDNYKKHPSSSMKKRKKVQTRKYFSGAKRVFFERNLFFVVYEHTEHVY